MRIHSIHHVPFEGLGTITAWLHKKQFKHSASWVHENNDFPSQEAFDALIVMGGPMSVHDEKEFPWLLLEKEFIRETIDAGKPVLGFCLGGQLIAQVLGANVEKAPHKEVGWFALQNYEQNILPVPEPFRAFHWHGEVFDIPQQAVCLWHSEACSHQGFIVKNAMAVQCHFEMTKKTVKALVENCPQDMQPAAYVQTEQEMLKDASLFESSQQFLFKLLDVWVQINLDND